MRALHSTLAVHTRALGTQTRERARARTTQVHRARMHAPGESARTVNRLRPGPAAARARARACVLGYVRREYARRGRRSGTREAPTVLQ